MKLLRVCANNFRNCEAGFTIDLTPVSKKTAMDKEYELQEIADGLYTFSTLAVVGKNASGKTSAVDLLAACYSILEDFRLHDVNHSYDGVELILFFYHDSYIYRYETTLRDGYSDSADICFYKEQIYRKEYFKSYTNLIYEEERFEPVVLSGELPTDISSLFFVLKQNQRRAFYFDSYAQDISTYNRVFELMRRYDIPQGILGKILHIFDENITGFERRDEHNYCLTYAGKTELLSDRELVYRISSGTTKGMLLYMIAVVSLQAGVDLIIDEIENHFHKSLVDNLISLFRDKSVNRNHATLVFTTHYCELLDYFSRQDNILVTRAAGKVSISKYLEFGIRPELLKSKQFYGNAFQTAVNYEALMQLKKELKK